MSRIIERGVFQYDKPIKIESYASIVGKEEGDGSLGNCFDEVVEDAYFDQPTWEKAESRFQSEAVILAIRKANITKEDIDIIYSGDLTAQCIASTYGLRDFDVPYMGIYGACSTMAEGIISASVALESGSARRTAAVTSSHFSTAERQFRMPLSYGSQRTPTSQRTCTASGAVLLSDKGKVSVVGSCIGKLADMGVTDMTNMGCAMAPAASATIQRYLRATKTSPDDYDAIVTGDLGKIGSTLLVELLQKQGIDISAQHHDCGVMMFDGDDHCGGSGCGCSASVLCGYFLPKLESHELRNILFVATGALMSTVAMQQGESIPSIAHLVHLEG